MAVYLERLADFAQRRVGDRLGLTVEGKGWGISGDQLIGQGINRDQVTDQECGKEQMMEQRIIEAQVSAAVEYLAVLHGVGMVYRQDKLHKRETHCFYRFLNV